MKVQLNKLLNNPYRDLDRYPLERNKIEALKRSIRSTGWWANISYRPHPTRAGYYQIAYGHHRVVAGAEVLGKGAEVELPEPKPYTNAQMLQMMASENSVDWTYHVRHDREMVRRAREFLLTEGSPSKYANKDTGPGAKSIAAFLGGTWTEKKVSSHLEILVAVEKHELDVTALDSLRSFAKQRALVVRGRGLPVNEQRILAELISSGEPMENPERDPYTKATGGGLMVSEAQRQANLGEVAVRDAAKKLVAAFWALRTCQGQLADVLAVQHPGLDEPLQVRQLLSATAELTQILSKVREWLVQQETKQKQRPQPPTTRRKP